MSEGEGAAKQVLLVIPVTQFRDEEVNDSMNLLARAGIRVTVGASSIRTCYGMSGSSIESGIALADARAEDYDAIVLAGGSSVPQLFWKDKTLIALVSAMAEAGKPVAAMSLATVVLARAKLLEGKRATVYYLPEAIEALGEEGATYVNEPVVAEGLLITGTGGPGTAALINVLLETLGVAPAAIPAS